MGKWVVDRPLTSPSVSGATSVPKCKVHSVHSGRFIQSGKSKTETGKSKTGYHQSKTETAPPDRCPKRSVFPHLKWLILRMIGMQYFKKTSFHFISLQYNDLASLRLEAWSLRVNCLPSDKSDSGKRKFPFSSLINYRHSLSATLSAAFQMI